MDSAARRPPDSTTTRAARAWAADSACSSRLTRGPTGHSTPTTDGTIGSDGPSASSTALVSVMGTSAVITAAAADTD